VHIDFKGNPSVISVMFKEGKPNPGLTKLWTQIPNKEGEPVALKDRIVNLFSPSN
jgi:carbonic anhydrase